MRIVKSASTLFIALLLVFTLSSCSGVSNFTTAPELPLLKPESLGQSVQINQLLTTRVQGQPRKLLLALAINDQQLYLTGLSSLGQKLFAIQYDGLQLQQDQSQWLDMELPGRDIVAQLQLAYWPLATLRKAYGPAWEIEQRPCLRKLSRGGRDIISIHYCQNNSKAQVGQIEVGDLLIQQHLFDLELQIRTLSVQAL